MNSDYEKLMEKARGFRKEEREECLRRIEEIAEEGRLDPELQEILTVFIFTHQISSKYELAAISRGVDIFERHLKSGGEIEEGCMESFRQMIRTWNSDTLVQRCIAHMFMFLPPERLKAEMPLIERELKIAGRILTNEMLALLSLHYIRERDWAKVERTFSNSMAYGTRLGITTIFLPRSDDGYLLLCDELDSGIDDGTIRKEDMSEALHQVFDKLGFEIPGKRPPENSTALIGQRCFEALQKENTFSWPRRWVRPGRKDHECRTSLRQKR